MTAMTAISAITHGTTPPTAYGARRPATTHVIATPNGYVVGYTARGQGSIVYTDDATKARKFPTHAAAYNWAARYVGAGYGLNADRRIVPATTTRSAL